MVVLQAGAVGQAGRFEDRTCCGWYPKLLATAQLPQRLVVVPRYWGTCSSGSLRQGGDQVVEAEAALCLERWDSAGEEAECSSCRRAGWEAAATWEEAVALGTAASRSLVYFDTWWAVFIIMIAASRQDSYR